MDFITPTVMKLFDLFLEDPMQEYHEREVVRRTRVSKGSANKILRMLADSGLLTREGKGRMVFYRLNLTDPLARQFKVLANVYLLRELTRRLREYARRVVLLGSSAQGTDVKDSDVDLFVLAAEKALARKEIGEFNRKTQRKIAPIIVDANEFVKLKRRDRALYENIEKGIILWQAE